MAIIIPDWFSRLDLRDRDDQKLRNKYFVKTAAMLHNPHGNLQELADAMGITLVSLYHSYSVSRGSISPRMALLLEKTIGSDKVPAKLIRPDLFR